MPLFELHAHTSECDLAAHASGAELVRIYHAAGYSGMVITDHYFATFYKWFAAGEVRFNKSPYGINDFLVFGCDEEFFLTAPRLNELTSLDELKAILPEGACVVLAHPFRVKMTVMDPAPLFGIEAYNGLTEPFRNGMAEDYARHFGKPVTAGSDCHHRDHACKGGIVTDRIIRTPRDLTDVLRSGEYTLYRGN